VPPGTLRSLANATVAPIAEQVTSAATDAQATGTLDHTVPTAGSAPASATSGA
jgi:hypothetical protein